MVWELRSNGCSAGVPLFDFLGIYRELPYQSRPMPLPFMKVANHAKGSERPRHALSSSLASWLEFGMTAIMMKVDGKSQKSRSE